MLLAYLNPRSSSPPYSAREHHSGRKRKAAPAADGEAPADGEQPKPVSIMSERRVEGAATPLAATGDGG